MKFFVQNESGEEFGPADVEMLYDWVQERRVVPTTKLRAEGNDEWKPANEVVPELFRAVQAGSKEHDSALITALLVTACCCMPLGVVSLVFALMSINSAKFGQRRRAAPEPRSFQKYGDLGRRNRHPLADPTLYGLPRPATGPVN